jgi:hypothetical protein
MDLFGDIQDPMPVAVAAPAPGTQALYAVVYCSPKDAHIQSIHVDRDKAIQCCEDQAAHMRKWRREYFIYTPGATAEPAAYVVVEVPILHGAKV